MGDQAVIPARAPEGKSDPKIHYQATVARTRWRTLYIKTEVISPKHKAAQRWLQTAAAELFEIAEVKIKIGGDIKAGPFEKGKPEDLVTLVLSRDAVLGIKYAVVASLDGSGTGKPSPMLERRELLAACDGIGPDGIFRRLVEKEAKLPEDDDLDEGSELEEMDKKLQPEQKKE